MAVYGGLSVLEIDRDGKVRVRKARVSDDTVDELNRNLLLFYTGTIREASRILLEQGEGISRQKEPVLESMHRIKEIGSGVLAAVESGDLSGMGELLDRHWRHKKKMSAEISNPRFDEIYEIARKNGALGGKITGAGGGGFFVFYVEEGHRRFRERMLDLGLLPLRYRFDFEGSKVLVNLRDSSL